MRKPEQKTPKAKTSQKNKLKKMVNIVLSVILVLLILMVGYIMISSSINRVPYVFGCAFVRIQSPSMEDTIPTGEYILVKKIDAADVKVDDVIMFYSRDPDIYGKANTHRVKEIIRNKDGSLEFVTKGDNNQTLDQVHAYGEDISGLYIKNLPAFTAVAKLVSKPWFFAIFILIPAILLLVFSIRDVVVKAKELEMEEKIQQELERMRQAGELPGQKPGDMEEMQEPQRTQTGEDLDDEKDTTEWDND